MEQSNTPIIPQEVQITLNKYNNDNNNYKSPVYAHYAQYIEALYQANNTTSTTSNTLNSQTTQDSIASTIKSEAIVLNVNEWRAIRDSQPFSNSSLCNNDKNNNPIILIPYPRFLTVCPEYYSTTNYFIMMEQQENNALIDLIYSQRYNNTAHDGLTVWINTKYNNPTLQQSFYTLIREYYSIKAIKRLIIQTKEQFSEKLKLYDNYAKTNIELETKLEADYNKILKEISVRKIHDVAQKLHELANNLLNNGYNIFNHDPHLITDTLIQILSYAHPHDSNGNSLLDRIIINVGNQYKTLEDSIYNLKSYFKEPTLDSIANSCNISSNALFNNLLNSCYIWLSLCKLENQDKESSNSDLANLREKAYSLYKESFILYQESYNFLPITTCLNRDLSNIAQTILDRLPNINDGSSESILQKAEFNFTINPDLCMYFNVNPGYEDPLSNNLQTEKDSPFECNCSACVTAYELFRSNLYRVVALPNLKQNFTNKNLVFHLSHHTNIIWKNKITGAAPDEFRLDNFDQIKDVCLKGERYHLSYNPPEPGRPSNIGHVIAFELDKEENVVLYNPQFPKSNRVVLRNNDKDKYPYWCSLLKQSSPLYYYRVDNCIPIIRYAERIVIPYESNNDPDYMKRFLHSLIQ